MVMAKTYRSYLPEQDLLLPPSLRDWLPENHLAYFVSDLIDQVDLRAIEAYYEQEERGYPPYREFGLPTSTERAFPVKLIGDEGTLRGVSIALRPPLRKAGTFK